MRNSMMIMNQSDALCPKVLQRTSTPESSKVLLSRTCLPHPRYLRLLPLLHRVTIQMRLMHQYLSGFWTRNSRGRASRVTRNSCKWNRRCRCRRINIWGRNKKLICPISTRRNKAIGTKAKMDSLPIASLLDIQAWISYRTTTTTISRRVLWPTYTTMQLSTEEWACPT